MNADPTLRSEVATVYPDVVIIPYGHEQLPSKALRVGLSGQSGPPVEFGLADVPTEDLGVPQDAASSDPPVPFSNVTVQPLG